ncbi:Fur-regulated basic protein B [Bacillus sp. OV322]|nr:Fur-regulated basic protein B [Bacillus sp. OV322]
MRELVEKNKRELMKDKVMNEKIEKRLEDKYLKMKY